MLEAPQSSASTVTSSVKLQDTSAAERPLLRPYMPELDSIRGAAILMVILYHAFFWTVDFSSFPTWEARILQPFHAGRFGVNLFFVLSGFLITGLLLNAKENPHYYRKFYIRRALRILPAYLATLLLLAFAGVSLKFIGLSFLYLSNLTPLFGVPIEYPVLWSLAVEEHFYLLWPLVVRLLTPRALVAISTAVIVGSPFLRWLSYSLAAPQGWVPFTIFDYTWNSADGLACGALLAVWLREFPPARATFAKSVAAVFAIGLLTFPLGTLSRHGPLGAAFQPVPWHLLFVALLGAVLLAGSRSEKRLRFPILEFFGEISYGLYLYHLLAFWAYDRVVGKGKILTWNRDPALGLSVRFLVCGVVAVGVAYLSRRYFEESFLRLKSRFAP